MAEATVPQRQPVEIGLAIPKINMAACNLKALHDLAALCPDGIDSQTFSIAAQALARDTCRELDGALVNLGEFPNGFLDD